MKGVVVPKFMPPVIVRIIQEKLQHADKVFRDNYGPLQTDDGEEYFPDEAQFLIGETTLDLAGDDIKAVLKIIEEYI